MTKPRAITTRGRRSPLASASLSTSGPGDPAATVPDAERTRRLGEMVAGLTHCDPDAALGAVRAVLAIDAGLDALDVVARATISVEAAIDDDSWRIPGYVRPADPSRRLSALRARRTRTPAPTAGSPGRASGDPLILDVRHDEPEVRLDLTRLDPPR